MGMRLDRLCEPTEFLDHEHDAVAALVRRALDGTDGTGGTGPADQAVRLYYAVRDGIEYEVYHADLSRTGLRASSIIRKGAGLCIHKSIVYAAALRSVGIPSRLVLADVRNHLASERLRQLIGGDLFRFHCLTSAYLQGRWVRATPVFSRTLCRLYRIAPLEFDGRTDSLYHPYDQDGRRHMEFVHHHGEFDDLPYDLVVTGMRAAHPRLFDTPDTLAAGSLVTEAQAENAEGSR